MVSSLIAWWWVRPQTLWWVWRKALISGLVPDAYLQLWVQHWITLQQDHKDCELSCPDLNVLRTFPLLYQQANSITVLDSTGRYQIWNNLLVFLHCLPKYLEFFSFYRIITGNWNVFVQDNGSAEAKIHLYCQIIQKCHYGYNLRQLPPA